MPKGYPKNPKPKDPARVKDVSIIKQLAELTPPHSELLPKFKDLTKETQYRIFCDLYIYYGTQAPAARATGVALRTIKNWREKDPTFREMIEDAKEESNELLEAQLLQCGMGRVWMDRPQVASAFGLLRARKPQQYVERFMHIHTGENGEPIKIAHIIFGDAEAGKPFREIKETDAEESADTKPKLPPGTAKSLELIEAVCGDGLRNSSRQDITGATVDATGDREDSEIRGD